MTIRIIKHEAVAKTGSFGVQGEGEMKGRIAQSWTPSDNERRRKLLRRAQFSDDCRTDEALPLLFAIGQGYSAISGDVAAERIHSTKARWDISGPLKLRS
jgi:hypothetical protein